MASMTIYLEYARKLPHTGGELIYVSNCCSLATLVCMVKLTPQIAGRGFSETSASGLHPLRLPLHFVQQFRDELYDVRKSSLYQRDGWQ